MATVKRTGNKQPENDPALAQAVDKAVKQAGDGSTTVKEGSTKVTVSHLSDKLARSRRP